MIKDDYNNCTISGFQGNNGYYYLVLNSDSSELEFCVTTSGSQIPNEIRSKLIELIKLLNNYDLH